MMFMNSMDIDAAIARQHKSKVLTDACLFLAALRDETDAHSDGWAYWRLPVTAARKLMELIQHNDNPSESEYRRALVPIKTFYTKHGRAAGMRWPEEYV